MTDTSDPPREERKNLLLRMLINEMLDQVRVIQRDDSPWAPNEREKAENDLERIMLQVRAEAVRQAHG